jgi:hypothetical protein
MKTNTRTSAADRFIDAIAVAWDHRDCWERTARLGLSDVDADALAAFCRESGEDFDEAEAEVLSHIRGRAIGR